MEILRGDCFLTTTSYRQVGKVLQPGLSSESAFDLGRDYSTNVRKVQLRERRGGFLPQYVGGFRRGNSMKRTHKGGGEALEMDH